MARNHWLPLITLLLALPAAAQVTATANTPVRDALAAGAANPDCSMGAVTGESCGAVDASAVMASTGSTKADPSRPAITHREDPVVPSPEPKKKSGSMLKGVEKYFAPDTVKAGVGFGAAFGMLLLAASPVGLIGGALIGAVIGAVLCGGLIQKLFHHKKS